MRRTRFTRFATDRRGNTTMIFALSLPVLIGFAGLGVENGYWFFRERQLQTAADLAAFAGSVSLRNDEPAAQAQSEAAAEAELHGFDGAVGSIAANTPPRSGPSQTDRAMEVLLTRTEERYFSKLFIQDPVVIRVRAVASYEEPNPACVLALDHDAPAAVDFFGNSNISLLNCEVMSNSIAPDALSLGGSADLETPCVNSVGGFVQNGGRADLSLTDCGAPRVDLPRAPDPYADVPDPDTSTPCENLAGGETAVTNPGGVRRFCGGLHLNGSYTFDPGVYVIDGGAFSINAGADVWGEDVTFYLTGGAEIQFNGAATIDITAPTTGDYAGLAFFGDRDDTDAVHTFNGTADSMVTGAIYMAGGAIEFLGDYSGDNGCMQLVGRTVRIGGGVDIETDCSGVGIQWARVHSDVRLVE